MKTINTARITHHHDPVPHLPKESWGFYHEPTEVGQGPSAPAPP